MYQIQVNKRNGDKSHQDRPFEWTQTSYSIEIPLKWEKRKIIKKLITVDGAVCKGQAVARSNYRP